MQHSGRITVIGAGFMGTVIATLYARHGYKVALHDTATQMLDFIAIGRSRSPSRWQTLIIQSTASSPA